MSYHRALGAAPMAFTPTTSFVQAASPYAGRFGPPGAIYSPYGWGPEMNVGMPFNYTHHIGYERVPIPGAPGVGPMYDRLPSLGGSWSGSMSPSGQQLAGVLAVL